MAGLPGISDLRKRIRSGKQMSAADHRSGEGMALRHGCWEASRGGPASSRSVTLTKCQDLAYEADLYRGILQPGVTCLAAGSSRSVWLGLGTRAGHVYFSIYRDFSLV